MPSQTDIRILVFHTNSDSENRLVEVINHDNRYKAFAAQVLGGALLMRDQHEEIKKRIAEFRCHILLLDQSLIGDIKDAAFLQDLQRAITPARCVLYTGATISTQRAMHAFINDVLLAPVIRRASGSIALESAVDHGVKRAKSQAIENMKGKEFLEPVAEKIGVELDEVYELMAYLFPDADSITIAPWTRDTTYQSVARGKSVLFTVSVDGKVEEFLKLAPSERIQIEAANYRHYVHGWLRGMRHAVLAQHKALWNVGGLVYSLIGTGMQIPPTFSEYYGTHAHIRGDAKKKSPVELVLESLLQSWSRHYTQGPTEPKPTEESLFDQYDSVWSNKLESKLSWCQEHIAPLDGFEFLPSPADWCIQHRAESKTVSMRQAITHGDLHGENILVDENSNCWLIDFERTGRGPILQDFVELEANILIRMTDKQDDLKGFFRVCVGLMAPSLPPTREKREGLSIAQSLERYLPLSDSLLNAALAIDPLLLLAHDHTRYMDSRERLWGLLLNAIYIMSLDIESDRRDRAFILGGVVCKRLEQWYNYRQAPNWPPKEWEEMLGSLTETQSANPPPASLPLLKLQLTDLRNLQCQFKVAVLGIPNKEPSAVSALPHQGDSLIAVMKLLEPGRYQPDRFSTAQVGAMEQLELLEDNRLVHDWCDRIGYHLFKALVPADGEVRAAFANVYHTDRKGGELQIIFDEDATDPACQPWEMIHDGFPKKPRAPIDVIRYIASDRPAQTLEVPQAPCQILYVTARPKGYAEPAHDRDAIKDSVASSASPGRFGFNELPDRTHHALKQRLLDTSAAPVHVLHFDGHGTFARLCPSPTCGAANFAHESKCCKCGTPLDNAHAPARGYLLFEDDQRKVKFIDTTRFLEGVQRSEVRLVVLSSCHSARVRGADLLLAGVGPGLILAGVPAVVAMQFSISDQDAIKFNQEFYLALANGDSLPTAVYRARTALDEPARWSPVLYLRSKDHQVHLCPPK